MKASITSEGLALAAAIVAMLMPSPAQAILIGAFLQLPSDEQVVRVEKVLKQMHEKYAAEKDAKGNDKPAEVRKRDEAFAKWILHTYFVHKDDAGEKEVIERVNDALLNLYSYLAVSEKDSPQMHMEQLVVRHVTNTYNAQQPPDGARNPPSANR